MCAQMKQSTNGNKSITLNFEEPFKVVFCQYFEKSVYLLFMYPSSFFS